MQKAGASSEGDALPPRDVTTEVIVARKALAERLAEQADRAGSPNSHSPQDPNLAVVLDFTAALVADLTYARKFADKETWNRRVGVYMAPWLPNQGDHGAVFAESVCKHFHAIEKVGIFHSFDLQPIFTFTGEALSRSRWDLGRRRTSLRHRLLPRIWCTSSPIAYDIKAIPWASVRYTGPEWIWEVDPYASATRWKSRELSAPG